jgi:serine/threonine protein kinase
MEQEAALLEIRELESEYEILGELGRGGMAVVYLARDRQLGRQVAIKVIHAAAGIDEAAVARQLVEARTVAQLQHPNVVAMYAVKRLSTLGLALVMQYIPGRTLELAMREDGRFTPERAEAVLVDVAAALSYAHARGVIHRDIKPDNIFLNDETGRALVSDFGIALSAEDRQQANDVIVGTPAYMSPEQIDGLDLDGRSDVFSLGLIGYEMLAGVRPWVDENISDVMYRQKFEMLPALAGLRPDAPDRLRVAIEQALAKSRDERWPGAGAFLAALTDDEWVPQERDQPARSLTPNRIAAHLGGRPVSGPAAGGTPLETVQYRRDGLPTPRRGSFAHQRGTRARRALRIALPVLLLGGGAAATVAMHPELLARYHLRLPGTVRDSVARVNAAAMAALRDSAARAIAAADGARHAADSAATAAVSNADSAAAFHLAAIRDSLAKAAADAKKALAVPISNAATPPAPRSRAQTADSAITAARRESATATPPPPPSPELIHPPSAPTLVAGGSHSCALSNDGSILCWGANDRGQLGLRGTARKTAPTRISTDVPFEQVAAGMADACAVARTGAAYCWGDNTYGQLGDSGAGPQPTPTRVSGGHTFRLIATGTTHSCGLTSTWQREHAGPGGASPRGRRRPLRRTDRRVEPFLRAR